VFVSGRARDGVVLARAEFDGKREGETLRQLWGGAVGAGVGLAGLRAAFGAGTLG